ncbi:hypothetical protein HYPSUDRAFT_201597 [Hypholoma sublateritium FD-334 SS-4]|uniref:Uncharacterized protein n=1 Tax=Hypholoma sublateritium (strain FD-334 SS-4) TaxID=945553 RepID=A0A0D2MI38_HYPSF|nr:hypothetical protein HYPSUDRAFT_201597 [Hypholoma sublateritium FD-334 SS-4]
MNLAGFEACIRAPSPVSTSLPLPSFGAPAHAGLVQSSQFFPAPSSVESMDNSVYSKPYSLESNGSRASWSSAEANWARRGMAVEEARRALQQENAELVKQVSTWQIKFETLQTAYNLLLERVPAPPEAARQKLQPEDYKNIDYWYKHQWVSMSANRVTEISAKTENENENENEDDDVGVDAEGEDSESVSPAPGSRRGQGRCRAGINVSMRYIQDHDGQVIDGHRAREIRIHARAIFVGFAMQGKHFASWGDADATSRRFFYNEMVIRFEELQYCDLDWKAEQIATDTFPGWKATWIKKQKKASLEQQNGLKRSRQKSIIDNPDLKRSKLTEMDAPMPSSSTSQQSVPVLNVIPNTPARPVPAVQPPSNPALLQPNKLYDFTIGNPLPNSNGVVPFQMEQHLPFVPAVTFGPEPPQPLAANAQAVLGNYAAAVQPIQNPPPTGPTKRLRTGATRMRPSKTSTTPRNLCALEWAISHPKGSTDEFGAYYDGLPAEGKEKWEKLSVEAKESGKTASDWVLGQQS